MSKFNQKSQANKVVNRAGAAAYDQSAELKLASFLLTNFLKDQFYRSGKQSQKELVELTAKVDPKFAAQAAVYARDTFGMRSVSHVVAGELSTRAAGMPWAKSFYEKIIVRPDDITEIMSYVGGKISHAMRKGFRTAMEGFNEYKLAKYKGNGKKTKLVDAVNLVHAHTPAISQLHNGTLKPAETWETKISQAGKSEDKAKAKAEAWEDLLRERKIGYMALLRNLRNITQQAPELVPVASEMLQDEKLIAKARIFPFQYLTAYSEVSDRTLLQAISKAIDISCKNVPKFSGDTLIAIDMSGSMGGKIREIANLFGAVMYKAMNARILMFDWNSVEYVANPEDSALTIAKNAPFHGGGTDFGSIFAGIKGTKFDRIFILSDMQSWGNYYGKDTKTLFNDYRRNVNPEARLYSFDLAGYGDMQFPENNVLTVAGFSEKVFDVIKQLEGGQSLVEQIKKVEF